MQPSEPLKPGETYLDEDLGIEVIVVESGGCSYPPGQSNPRLQNASIVCIAKSAGPPGHASHHTPTPTSCTYPSCSTRRSNSRNL